MGKAQSEGVRLGRRVRDARMQAIAGREMSQEELARRSGLGQQTISKIERGVQKTLSPDQVKALATALSEDPYYLFTGERPYDLPEAAGKIAQIERDTPFDFYAVDSLVTLAQNQAARLQAERAATKSLDQDALRRELAASGLDAATIDRVFAAATGTAPDSGAPTPETDDRRAGQA